MFTLQVGLHVISSAQSAMQKYLVQTIISDSSKFFCICFHFQPPSPNVQGPSRLARQSKLIEEQLLTSTSMTI